MTEIATASQETDTTASLAGDFLVHGVRTAEACRFQLYPLSNVSVDPAFEQSKDARAYAALHRPVDSFLDDESLSSSPDMVMMEAMVDRGVLKISCHSRDELVTALSLILAQWASVSVDSIHLPDGRVIDSSSFQSNHKIRQVFGASSTDEIVEMTDLKGRCLGRVPRKLVHVHNLLHRGIGVFVTASSPMVLTQASSQPNLYVHQRTSTKRIFPSLYDMFVGGISLAGEDAAVTAHREVAEELGLRAADHLSHAILPCVVCTAYNRCVVTLFEYTMDLAEEVVQWQKEEVMWGSFVPYDVIEAAADRSIQRLVDRQSWPSRLPAIQSDPLGEVENISYEDQDWRKWDFVPDGLLVWEAWLRFLNVAGQRRLDATINGVDLTLF